MVVARGYKSTEIGVYPDDWTVATLESLIDPFRSIRYGIVQPGKFDPSGRYMIRGQDYSKGWVNPSQMFRVSARVEERYKNARVAPGDIVITIVGAGTGLVDEIPEWLHGANLTQTTARIAIDSHLADSGFCKSVLQSHIGARQVSGYLKGAAQPGLNCGDIAKFLIPLPPTREEQVSIATSIRDIDLLLNILKQQLGKKRNFKRAVMQTLLTGKARLPGFAGDWKPKSIIDLEKERAVVLSRGQVISKKDIEAFPGDYPIYSSSVQNGGLFGYYGRHMFNEELITWSIDGGGDFFYRAKHKFSVTNVCGFMRLDTSQLDCQFVASQLQLLHSPKVFDYQSKAHPSVIRKEYTLTLPPLPEQHAIARVLSQLQTEIDSIEMYWNKVRDLKKAVMQELLTGKTRLSGPYLAYA